MLNDQHEKEKEKKGQNCLTFIIRDQNETKKKT